MQDDDPKVDDALNKKPFPNEPLPNDKPESMDDDSSELTEDVQPEVNEADNEQAYQDQLLEASEPSPNEDAEQPNDSDPKVPQTLMQKIKSGFRAWWINKKLRYATFAGIAVFLLLVGAIPPSRYFVLNTIGIRSKASIVVFDDQSENPLKNVQVSIGDSTAKTDIDGKAQLTGVKLGKNTLKVKKLAYAESEKTVTIGWGSNPLGNSSIKAVGAQYSFELTDWLSGKPLDRVEASVGEFDASSDEKGILTLVVDAKQAENLSVVFKLSGYRDEKVAVASGTEGVQKLKMVSYRKHPFISKRSGKYDLYKIDADGKNEKLVLPGTGSENESIGLVPHPNLEITALTSARENLRNKQGFLLTTLSVVDLKDDSATNIAQSEQIQIIGWSGDSLVYVQIAAGASAASAKRQRLVAYNYKTEDKVELASNNNFNDVMMVGDKVYFAQSAPQPGLFVQNVEGKNRNTILNKDTWNIFRSTYDNIDISAEDEWYQLRIGETNAKKLANQPSSQKSRIYSDSNNGEQSLWVDERDGKGTLVLYDIKTGKEKTLVQQAGLENPVRWLSNNTLVYRVRTQQESADYVLNVDGGGAKKIRDVTATFGIERWYH